MNLKNGLIILASLIGGGVLTLFFDARPLVWILAAATILVAGFFGGFALRQKIKKYPAVYYAALAFISWTWFAIIFGLRALQIIPRSGAAPLLLLISAGLAYFWFNEEKNERTKQLLFFVLAAEGAVALLFAPAWFLVLGALATIWSMIFGAFLAMEKSVNARRVVLTIATGIIIIAFFIIGFKWKL